MPGADNRYSRTIASAQALGESARDRNRFLDKTVLLTGEPTILGTPNGREMARAALLLLMRICPNVVVALPDACADLAGELDELAHHMDPKSTIICDILRGQFGDFDAILSVGTCARGDLPWTVINSNGWLARVSSSTHDIVGECRQANPIGAIGAACLGVCEVFKRLIALASERGEMLDNVSFSFWTYSAATGEPGPALPPDIRVELLLVGAGAIGSGTAYLLSRLPISGRALVIDRQYYEDVNWGTCVCISTDDIGKEKAQVLATVLASKLSVRGRRVDIETFRRELEAMNAAPRIVLNGLDDIDPRQEVQKLWPDLVIDGAIGSDFSCQVSCHPWGLDVACLRCLFRHPPSTEPWEKVMSRDTGLPESFFADPNATISEEHLATVPPEKRASFSRYLGKTWCSITPEEQAQMLSSEKLAPGFSPSAPFVACFSSCMIVTELVRQVLESRTNPEPRFQLNLLWGPQRGTDVPQARRSDCECVMRGRNIERARATRQRLELG